MTLAFSFDFRGRVYSLFPGPRAIWTLVGLAAIPLWALWPLLAVVAGASIPPLQFTTLIFAIAAAALFALKTTTGAKLPALSTQKALERPVPVLMVAIGIFFSNLLFLYAARFMPAAQANPIVYTWPY